MTTLTINVNSTIKQKAQEMSRQEGATLTFVVNQFLKLYVNNKIKFSLISNNEDSEFLNLSANLTKLAEEKIDTKNLPSLSSQLGLRSVK